MKLHLIVLPIAALLVACGGGNSAQPEPGPRRKPAVGSASDPLPEWVGKRISELQAESSGLPQEVDRVDIEGRSGYLFDLGAQAYADRGHELYLEDGTYVCLPFAMTYPPMVCPEFERIEKVWP